MVNKLHSSFLSALILLISTPSFAIDLKKIKIGVILPLSGNVSAYGEDVRDALLFANENLAGGKFEFIFEDDHCNGKEAVTAAAKLISQDQIKYGVVVCTESMISAAPVFESHKVLVLTPIASGAAVSQAGDYIFRTWPGDAGAGRLLFEYVSSRHKKIGILSEDAGYSQDFINTFLKAAQGSDLEIVSVNFPVNETDFRTALLKLRAAKVEGLLFNSGGSPPLSVFLKQLRELRWSVPISSAYQPGNKVFLDTAGKSAEGIVFVDAPPLQEILNTDGANLFRDFQARYGAPRSIPLVFASTFEVLRLLNLISEQHGDPRAYLYHETFNGVFGKYTFDSNGDIVGLKHVMRVIKDSISKPLSPN